MIDVARAAGVSLGTVSNVVNNPGKVTPATRQKVEAAIAELGFVRNGVARSLRAGRSTTIGFVLVDLGNSFFLDLVRGAEEEVDRAGMNLLLANADMSWDKEQTYLALFEEERVAGILLTPRPVPGEVEHLPPASAGVPRVLINDPEAGADVCSVHDRQRARRLPRGPAPHRDRATPAAVRRRATPSNRSGTATRACARAVEEAERRHAGAGAHDRRDRPRRPGGRRRAAPPSGRGPARRRAGRRRPARARR